MEALIDALQPGLSLRIAIAFLLGALVGIERERRSKAAGLRTHMLVSGGSAIFTVASVYLFKNTAGTNDPARIAAQIVTGIGFLGAGAILRSKDGISGLTTAATIWVAAGLGMLAGVGAYGLALVSACFALVALIAPHKWLRRDRKRSADDEESLLPGVRDRDSPRGDRR